MARVVVIPSTTARSGAGKGPWERASDGPRQARSSVNERSGFMTGRPGVRAGRTAPAPAGRGIVPGAAVRGTRPPSARAGVGVLETDDPLLPEVLLVGVPADALQPDPEEQRDGQHRQARCRASVARKGSTSASTA